MQASHSLHVTPHVVLATDGPRASEVVNMLLVIEIAQTALSEQASPDDIPSWSLDVAEACHLESIDDTIVSMRCLTDPEARHAVGFELLLCVLYDARVVAGQVALLAEERWIREEDEGLSGWEWRLDHRNDLVWRSPQEFVSDCILSLFVCHVCVVGLDRCNLT